MPATLLAIDLGLRTGLALYGADGRLQWYRSQNYGTRNRLKRGAYGLLGGLDGVAHLVLEGGGDLAALWMREAERRGVVCHLIQADAWRERLLLPRQRRDAATAKAQAGALARRVIAWSGADRPTSLRHDAAEAILAGLWGVLAVGWLAELPADLQG
ncbi:MAG: hypothetical protein D6685_12245 [Bacteroidetes bacterium]|nr:hypothetical protein AWN76_016300 [Rhodothermaceae bacterium RA]RMH58156.1 MAG: hypothetical protein D6685_12245 [Bacteroidota bacterium]